MDGRRMMPSRCIRSTRCRQGLRRERMGLYGIHSHALGIYPLIQSNGERSHSHVAISSRCKHVVKRACYDNSTSNLWDHVNAKHPELPSNQGTVTNFARGSTYTPEKLRLYEVFWCCSSARPFSIIMDEWLIKIFQMFHPGFKEWSEQTISRDTREIFKIAQRNMKTILRVSLHFGLL